MFQRFSAEFNTVGGPSHRRSTAADRLPQFYPETQYRKPNFVRKLCSRKWENKYLFYLVLQPFSHALFEQLIHYRVYDVVAMVTSAVTISLQNYH